MDTCCENCEYCSSVVRKTCRGYSDNGIIFDMVQQEYTLTDVTSNLTSNPTSKLKMYWGNR